MNGKLKKSILATMIFLVLIISIGAISAADSDSLNETLAADDVPADSLEESSTDVLSDDIDTKTFTELRNEISTKSTVDLGHDYTYSQEDDLEDGITINKTVTINGHGFKIDSTSLAKLFTVTSTGNLTINDVVLVTDYTTSDSYLNAREKASFRNSGIVCLNNVTFITHQNLMSDNATLAAPIYNDQTLNIINSKFIDSTINTNTPYCLGIIDNKGGNVKIENTLFDNNKVIDTYDGSDPFSINSLIYNNMGILTLINVNMTNNSIKSSKDSHGLIKDYADSTQLSIDNCRFENNSIDLGSGVVIYSTNAYSGDTMKTTISNSKFINNTGAKNGGAIYSTFAITFENNTFERNTASEYGGAINSASKDTIYINNTFIGNKAKSGGAIYSSQSLQSSSSIFFRENTFIDNYASLNGGAIYAGAIGTLQYPIENNIFIHNEAASKGGAIYSTSSGTTTGGVRVTKTLFQRNIAKEGVAIYTTLTNPSQITYTIFDNNQINSATGTLLYYRSSSTAEDNYWGTNTPNFNNLIKYSNSGTVSAPEDFAVILIEGEEILTSSDIYSVSFKGNTSKEVINDLPNYEVFISSTLNNVTPTTVVIKEGEASFTYNATNRGQDTIKVSKNNVEITSFAVFADITKTSEFTIVAGDVNYGEDLNFTFTIANGPSGENIYQWKIFSKSGLQLESGYVTQNNEIITTKSYNAGNYTIEVSLTGYEGWSDLSVDDTFEIRKIQSEIKPTVTVKDDDTVEISINVTSNNKKVNASGEVSFEIDILHGKDVENGTATVTTNKLSPNKYTVTLNYSGDSNYIGTTENIEFTIKKDVNADAFNIDKSDENKTATFSIKLDEDAKGNLTVTIGEKIESKALNNGEANITISGLTKGPHDVTLTYTGDENHKQKTITTTVEIMGKEIPEDERNVSMNIPEGTTSPIFTINLPKDATGNFTVYVDGKKYSETLVNGSATITAKDLTVGNHILSTEYTGDANYSGFKTENKTVNIPKATIPGGENAINMTPPADSATPSYSIKLPEDAKGNLTVTVDGKDTYTEALVNGSATVNVPELAAGKHNITVTYTGDAKYSSISKDMTVSVPEKAKPATPSKTNKVATKITAKNKKFKAKTKVKKYTITLKAGKKPVKKVQVTIKIGKKTYKAKTNAKGKATFKIKKLTKKCKYKAVIKFKGNANYKASSKKVKITIK